MLNRLILFIRINYFSLVLAIGSIWHSLELFVQTEIFYPYSLYQGFSRYINNYHIATIFLVSGLLKLLAIFLNNFKFRRFMLTILIFIWSFFAASFMLTEPPNTVKVYATIVAALAVGISIQKVE